MLQEHIQSRMREIMMISASSPLERMGRSWEPMPAASLSQVRSICKMQQRAILERVVSVRPIDLYEEISRICPAERDICFISAEEVASRLSLYNTKLGLEHKITAEESGSEQSWSGEREEGFFREVRFEEVGLIEEQRLEEQVMRSIFDECDNNAGWNHLEYFELN